MLPKDIISILEKYKTNNEPVIRNINNNIESIISQLRIIRKSLSNQISNLTDNDIVDNDKEGELLKDSQRLRNYINSIQSIQLDLSDENIHFVQEEIITTNEVQLAYQKPVRLYLCIDNVCPSCGCGMEETTTKYTFNTNNFEHKKSLDSHKCPVCNRYFVTEYNIDGIDIEASNIELMLKFYNRILFNDIVYVVDSINKHSSDNHKLVDKKCIITLIQPDGETYEKIVEITHCETCNKLYMLKDIYDNLDGVPVCAIIDETKLQTVHNCNEIYIAENTKGSKLTQYGYNVNCIDKLSATQRRNILLMQLLSGNMERTEIISIINSDIQRCESSMNNGSKRDLREAIQKWKEDKEFVEKVLIERGYQYVKVSKIILQYNR